MPWAVAGAVIGAGASIYASGEASDAQAEAAARAAAIQKEQYEQTRADFEPYRAAGTSALSTYRDALGQNGADASKAAWGSYTESPYLPGLLSKVRDSVEASNAARGGLFSGSTAQAIGDRSTQAYLEDSNTWLDRMRGLVETGGNATAQVGSFGANAATGRANAATNAGNATANNWITSANSFNNFLSQAAGAYGDYRGRQNGSSTSLWNTGQLAF